MRDKSGIEVGLMLKILGSGKTSSRVDRHRLSGKINLLIQHLRPNFLVSEDTFGLPKFLLGISRDGCQTEGLV